MFSSLFIGIVFKIIENLAELFDPIWFKFSLLRWDWELFEISNFVRTEKLFNNWLVTISRNFKAFIEVVHDNKGSELHLWIFENINLSQFFDLEPFFLRNQINSSLWAYKAVQSALKLSNEEFKTEKNYVNNRMIYIINCFRPQMPERKWDVGLSWIFYPQFGLATICGFLLFPAGYQLVSGGYPLLTRRQLSWSSCNVARGD